MCFFSTDNKENPNKGLYKLGNTKFQRELIKCTHCSFNYLHDYNLGEEFFWTTNQPVRDSLYKKEIRSEVRYVKVSKLGIVFKSIQLIQIIIIIFILYFSII